MDTSCCHYPYPKIVLTNTTTYFLNSLFLNNTSIKKPHDLFNPTIIKNKLMMKITGGHEPLKSSPEPKKRCAVAHENGQKWQNRRVLTTSQFSCTGGHEPLKSSRIPKKTVCPMKTARNDQIDEFWRRPNFCVPGVTSCWYRLRSRKLCAIAHEIGQKWPNRWVLTTSKFSSTRGHQSLKSSRNQKLCAIAHENGQIWPNRRVLMTSQFSCTGGHEPKTRCYSPQK